MTNLVKNGANGKFWEIPAKTLEGDRPTTSFFLLARAICETFNKGRHRLAEDVSPQQSSV